MNGNDERGIALVDDLRSLLHIAFFKAVYRRAVQARFGTARLHHAKTRLLEFGLQLTGNGEVHVALFYARGHTHHSAVNPTVTRVYDNGEPQALARSYAERKKTNSERNGKG